MPVPKGLSQQRLAGDLAQVFQYRYALGELPHPHHTLPGIHLDAAGCREANPELDASQSVGLRIETRCVAKCMTIFVNIVPSCAHGPPPFRRLCLSRLLHAY